jgi:putative transcriptional regulator
MNHRCLTAIVLFAFVGIGSIGGTAQEGGDKPLFLVARPELADPLFQSSVVLMLPVSAGEPVVGLIVNKPTQLRLREIFPKDSALRERSDTIYFGGPVDVEAPGVVFRASRPSKQAIHLIGDLYVSFDSHFIEETLKKQEPGRDVRIFAGRAQWAPDQLEDEMLRGAWYNERAESSWIFSRDSGNVWRTLLDREQRGPMAQLPDSFSEFWTQPHFTSN